MADLKTKPTRNSVKRFIDRVPDARKRADSLALVEIMAQITKEPPILWGPSIVGFGTYHYRYESGHEGDACRVGFSPRKEALTLYMALDLKEIQALLPRLGKCRTGKVCLYIKRLEDVDLAVLKKIILQSYRVDRSGASMNV